jgi:hypothetical protein
MAAWLHDTRGQDVVLYCIDGGEVRAHSEFLRNVSWYFNKLLNRGDFEGVVPFSSSVVSAAMVYLYCGSVDIEEEDKAGLLQFLSFLELREFGTYGLLSC